MGSKKQNKKEKEFNKTGTIKWDSSAGTYGITQPQIIIQIDNTAWNEEKVSLFSHNDNDNSNRVFISSVFTTVTYKEVLMSLVSQPRKLNGIYLQCIDGKQNVVSTVFAINSTTASGEQYICQIIPTVDIHQFQSGITYTKFESPYILSVQSKLIFKVPARTLFHVRLFTDVIK